MAQLGKRVSLQEQKLISTFLNRIQKINTTALIVACVTLLNLAKMSYYSATRLGDGQLK